MDGLGAVAGRLHTESRCAAALALEAGLPPPDSNFACDGTARLCRSGLLLVSWWQVEGFWRAALPLQMASCSTSCSALENSLSSRVWRARSAAALSALSARLPATSESPWRWGGKEMPSRRHARVSAAVFKTHLANDRGEDQDEGACRRGSAPSLLESAM